MGQGHRAVFGVRDCDELNQMKEAFHTAAEMSGMDGLRVDLVRESDVSGVPLRTLGQEGPVLTLWAFWDQRPSRQRLLFGPAVVHLEGLPAHYQLGETRWEVGWTALSPYSGTSSPPGPLALAADGGTLSKPLLVRQTAVAGTL